MCHFVSILVSIDDLFTIGLGLEIGGAYLLGRGLLVSPIDILRRAEAYWGASPVTVVSAVKDKTDGVVGLAALVGGFASRWSPI